VPASWSAARAGPTHGRGRLRIAAFESAAATIVPLAVAAFSERHPDVELFLVVAAGHPLASKSRVRLADAADEPWITGRSDLECNRLVSRACRAAGFEPAVAFSTDDYAAAQGLVAAGVGVALIAELGLYTRRDDVVVRSLGPETPLRRVHAIAATPERRSPAASAMLAVLREVTVRYRASSPALALAS